MTTDLHQKRHEFLHKCFLELTTDYLESNKDDPEPYTISDLLEWSHKQTTEKKELNEQNP
jgi:hypothetical protein